MTPIEATLTRSYERPTSGLRPLTIIPNVSPFAEGSALVKLGETHVHCTATVEDRVPRWMLGKGKGWITAEYAMLPRATKERTQREAAAGKQGGRTVEIQRLIGRSLRMACDLSALGERQIIIDCDVLQADGGTRCAAITGGYVALALAVDWLIATRRVTKQPLTTAIAAVSAGVVRGVPVVDLDYAEDVTADVDFNIVMTGANEFVEVQGTAESVPFDLARLQAILALAQGGLTEIFAAQQVAIAAGKRPAR